MDMDTLIYDCNGGEFPKWDDPLSFKPNKKAEENK